MSRSEKNKNIIKDSSNSIGKKLASKKYRRITKDISKEITKDFSNIDDFEDEWLYPHGYEVENPYNVCDYKFYIDPDSEYGKKKLNKNKKLRK